jgi:hypothetical protein
MTCHPSGGNAGDTPTVAVSTSPSSGIFTHASPPMENSAYKSSLGASATMAA